MKTVVTYLKIISVNSPEETEENHKNFKISRERFKV